MNKWSVTAILISWVSIGNAAEAMITGVGHVKSSPDYIELNILVDSKCYSTPSDARKINDEAARKIVDFLNSKIKKKDNYNTVISTGGYTQPYQTYYQDKYFCKDTFQKQNNIIFRTQDIDNFESLFDEIQNTVYKQISRFSPLLIESSISYATISSPVPGISQDLRSQLEQKALGLAFQDASAKLSALLKSNKIQNLKMVKASEIPPTEPMPFFQKRIAPMEMMAGGGGQGDSRVPVQFDEQDIDKTIYFQFTFDDISLP
ncbi:MAG: SIMPL domain-containing protein [Gammaproteobacteria bacterium]|jgi:uncharacterized protein YggE|nr:SIMPL domain-containing protein [Gammaproteobacteria bacterium]